MRSGSQTEALLGRREPHRRRAGAGAAAELGRSEELMTENERKLLFAIARRVVELFNPKSFLDPTANCWIFCCGIFEVQ